jgi:hypothetical protein
MTERARIIDQAIDLHFVSDAICLHAIFLLETAGYQTARMYLEITDINQKREINRGRMPGHSILDGWVSHNIGRTH